MPTNNKAAVVGETDLGWAVARVVNNLAGQPVKIKITCKGCDRTNVFPYGPVMSAFEHAPDCKVLAGVKHHRTEHDRELTRLVTGQLPPRRGRSRR